MPHRVAPAYRPCLNPPVAARARRLNTVSPAYTSYGSEGAQAPYSVPCLYPQSLPESAGPTQRPLLLPPVAAGERMPHAAAPAYIPRGCESVQAPRSGPCLYPPWLQGRACPHAAARAFTPRGCESAHEAPRSGPCLLYIAAPSCLSERASPMQRPLLIHPIAVRARRLYAVALVYIPRGCESGQAPRSGPCL